MYSLVDLVEGEVGPFFQVRGVDGAWVDLLHSYLAGEVVDVQLRGTALSLAYLFALLHHRGECWGRVARGRRSRSQSSFAEYVHLEADFARSKVVAQGLFVFGFIAGHLQIEPVLHGRDAVVGRALVRHDESVEALLLALRAG